MEIRYSEKAVIDSRISNATIRLKKGIDRTVGCTHAK